MPSLFDPATEASVRQRAARLTPSTPAHWGRMHAGQMLCHLVDGFRVPLGEAPAEPKWTPFRYPLLRWLFIYLLPWPKGKVPTMPVFQQTQPDQWEGDCRAWEAALGRFVARGRQADGRWSPHPAFGPLPNWEWGRMVYLHIDHHFRQFGV
jgi:hypothetical protein